MHADLKNKHYLSWLKFLKKSESWTKKEIEKYQLSELQRVVRIAYERTKNYRKLYDKNGVSSDQIRSLEDFRKIPFVQKTDIQKDLEGFSQKMRGADYITTGGSTGIPFGFYRTKEAFAKELASKAYQYYRIGWKEGDPQMVLRGLIINSSNRMRFYPRFNELRCSSYYLTPEYMELYRKKAFSFKPKWLKCYPSSGYLFAKFLKETKKPFPKIKGILCASENLYDFQKELLSEVFGCRVFSHYGHYELGVIAGFCEYEDTYHVLPQYGFAELIGKDGELITQEGQIGEIVATSFIMEATPFIRYRTRDFATLKGYGCSKCKRPYQIWKRIDGRLQEIIVTKNGRYISMTSINMHDDIFDTIVQFQFYQEKKGEIIFRYIPKTKVSSQEILKIKERLLLKFGKDVDLIMKEVGDIPLTPRGKHRFLIQKLNIGYGDV